MIEEHRVTVVISDVSKYRWICAVTAPFFLHLEASKSSLRLFWLSWSSVVVILDAVESSNDAQGF